MSDFELRERLKAVLDEKDETVNSFSKKYDFPQRKMSRQVNEDTAIGYEVIKAFIDAYSDIDIDWLLTGRGEMLRNATITKHHNPRYNEKLKDYEVVPVYRIEAAANLSTIFENGVEFIDGYITLPDMSSVDGAVPVRGDSMYPILKSGDMVVYKKVSSPEYIIYGQMYLVEYNWDGDTHVVVKYINRSENEGYICLVSHNEYHQPMDVALSDVIALALVKVSIRYHTMK